jgi:hypothetical protein
VEFWKAVLWALRVGAAGWVAWLYLMPPTVVTYEEAVVSCSPLRGGERYDLRSVDSDEIDAADRRIDYSAQYGSDLSRHRHDLYMELDYACGIARDDRSVAIYLIVAALILSFVVRWPGNAKSSSPQDKKFDPSDTSWVTE